MDTKGGIFNELRKIQEQAGGYVPEQELYRLAARLGKGEFVKGEFIRGVCDVYSVASFYPEFRFTRPPKVEVRVCTALPCYLKGAEVEYRRIEAAADGRQNVNVGRCPCLGRCDQAPAMTVNGRIFVSSGNPDSSEKKAASAAENLSEMVLAYLNWADPSKAGEAPRVREAPPHAHRPQKPHGIPRFEEIGRKPELKGKYRTDPYHEISEHYGELRRLLGDGELSASHRLAVEDSRKEADEKRKSKADADVSPVVATEPPPRHGVQLVRDQIKRANLRGMGGAGKPFLRKFDQVLTADAAEKYVVVNADESEPGTIKDREMLKRFPHLLVEALAIVGISVGATKGYIYLRHEYEEQAEAIHRELRWAYADKCLDAESKIVSKDRFLGENILGSGVCFDVELFISPGGYVMGEQSALLQAIEGQRGMPRNGIFDLGEKKGLPTGNGLWGMPTIVSNVETYTYLPVILRRGGEWFVNQGINGCQGLKWASVCGDVNHPCVRELSMGTTFRQMIFGHENGNGVVGGKGIKAFAPSGPSFGFLPGSDQFLDLPMDFPADGADGKPNPIAAAGATVGSGAIIVLAEGRSVVEGALNFTRFFRNESCGKCVPCRVGSQKMVDVIKQIRFETFEQNKNEIARLKAHGDETLGAFVGELRKEHEATVQRLSGVLDMMSICGLGRVVHVPIQSVLKHWPQEIDAHLRGEGLDSAPAEPRGDDLRKEG